VIETTYRFAVAVEDRGQFDAVTRLADRVLQDALPWCGDILDDLRRWGTGHDERPWHYLTKAYEAARERGLKPYGHFDGEPALADAAMVRAQLLLFQADLADGLPIDGVVLARDIDDDPERSDGFSQALASRWPFPVIAALCAPEVEAWLVAGFEPEDEGQQERLVAERRHLGFSPPLEPHRLSSKRRQDRKDAKAVLDRLCAADHDRRHRCLEVPMAILHERGRACGLHDFLDEVRTKLVPVLQPR
jgi:hypothetical protein